MAKSEFSETQFMFGYLKELWGRNGVFPYFMFPTQFLERQLPVDFFVDFYSHSEFYQFKRSNCYAQKRGAIERKAGVPASYLPYYCFHVYNRTTATALGQFEKLIELARHSPNDLVCYCAPFFHTEFEYLNHFANNTIIDNSVIIECAQFDAAQFRPPNFDINVGDHHLVYKQGAAINYICSQAIELQISKYSFISQIDVNRFRNRQRFTEYVDTLYTEVYLRDEILINNDQYTKDRAQGTAQKMNLIFFHLMSVYDILWIPFYNG